MIMKIEINMTIEADDNEASIKAIKKIAKVLKGELGKISITENTYESIKEDSLIEDVKKFIIEKNAVSATLLQRKFSIGFARACAIIDYLEDKGYVGPHNGPIPREIYI